MDLFGIDEITLDILKFLPVRDILNFCSTRKENLKYLYDKYLWIYLCERYLGEFYKIRFVCYPGSRPVDVYKRLYIEKQSVCQKRGCHRFKLPNIAYCGVHRTIPKNLQEAYKVDYLITNKRSSRTNRYFTLSELKILAKNLNISISGNKNLLVGRILDKLKSYSDGTPGIK